MRLPDRRRPAPRLREFDYASPRAYFVTLCTAGRKRLLGSFLPREPGTEIVGAGFIPPGIEAVGAGFIPPDDFGFRATPIGEVVAAELRALPERHAGLALDAWVVMPDHLHAILRLPGGGRCDLRDVVGRFKAGCTRRLPRARGRAAHATIWQRSFYDRVIRTERELQAFRRYIAENPVRWILKNGRD